MEISAGCGAAEPGPPAASKTAFQKETAEKFLARPEKKRDENTFNRGSTLSNF
jgi:hypothetical protein